MNFSLSTATCGDVVDKYTGNIHQATDKYGNKHECQKWNSQSPHGHNIVASDMRNPADYNTNKCRSPHEGWAWFIEIGRHEKPWCYTTDPNTEWAECDVPQCGKNFDY